MKVAIGAMSHTYPLGRLQQKLNFHRFKRKDNPTVFSAVEYPGVKQRSDIAMHRFYISPSAARSRSIGLRAARSCASFGRAAAALSCSNSNVLTMSAKVKAGRGATTAAGAAATLSDVGAAGV